MGMRAVAEEYKWLIQMWLAKPTRTVASFPFPHNHWRSPQRLLTSGSLIIFPERDTTSIDGEGKPRSVRSSRLCRISNRAATDFKPA